MALAFKFARPVIKIILISTDMICFEFFLYVAFYSDNSSFFCILWSRALNIASRPNILGNRSCGVFAPFAQSVHRNRKHMVRLEKRLSHAKP